MIRDRGHATAICISALLFVVMLGSLLWVAFPADFKSELGTFSPLTEDEFADLRSSAAAFARTVENKGIAFRSGSELSHSFSFSCKGVPLLLVDNGPGVLFVDVMARADRRAPDLLKFREAMYSRLERSGRPGGDPGPPEEPVGFEAFVLKHRDGIDVTQRCN